MYSASKTNALYKEKRKEKTGLTTNGTEISSDYDSEEYETEIETENEIASDPGIQPKGYKLDYKKVYGNLDKEMANQRNKPIAANINYKPVKKFVPDKFNVLKQQGPKYSKPMPVSKPRKELTKELAALNKQIMAADKKKEVRLAKPFVYQGSLFQLFSFLFLF